MIVRHLLDIILILTLIDRIITCGWFIEHKTILLMPALHIWRKTVNTCILVTATTV